MTAVVAILLTAPIGLVCINLFGDKWLTNDLEAIALAKLQAKEDYANNTNSTNSAGTNNSKHTNTDSGSSPAGGKKRTGSFGDGGINIGHSDSFLQGVTDFFSTFLS